MNVQERITRQYADFSTQERRAADVLLEHLPDLASYRAAELAELAGVSRATMSRFVRRLGFDDFETFRTELRAAGVPLALNPSPGLDQWLGAEIAVLRRAFEHLDPATLDAAASALATADRVVVLGRRTSYPLATHLYQQLVQVRGAVALAPSPGQSLADDLVDLGANDVLVLVASRRRPRGTQQLIDAVAGRGVRVVLLADPTAGALMARATWSLVFPLSTHGAFDGYAAAMSLISLLADRVGTIAADGWNRAGEIDDLYQLLDEVES